MSDKMREEFEAAIALETGRPVLEFRDDRRGESYASTGPKYAWWGWKASREALVIEWPDQHTYTVPDCAGAAILDCRTAFSKAVKVKP